MNIYTDEMPKTCGECCLNCGLFCGATMNDIENDGKDKQCPLKQVNTDWREKALELAVSQIVKLSDRIGDCETSCPAYEICKGLGDGDCRNIVIDFFENKAKEMIKNE